MNFPSQLGRKIDGKRLVGIALNAMIAAIDLIPSFFLSGSSDGASSSRVREFKRIDDESSRAQGARSYKILGFFCRKTGIIMSDVPTIFFARSVTRSGARGSPLIRQYS